MDVRVILDEVASLNYAPTPAVGSPAGAPTGYRHTLREPRLTLVCSVNLGAGL